MLNPITIIYDYKIIYLYLCIFIYVVVQLLSYVWLFGRRGLQHVRLLCPLLSPGVCSNSYSLRWWCYLTISSSAAPFSFCLQSFPVAGSVCVCVCVCVCAHSYLTFCEPMDYNPPGSSDHGISQTRILERVAISSFKDLSISISLTSKLCQWGQTFPQDTWLAFNLCWMNE